MKHKLFCEMEYDTDNGGRVSEEELERLLLRGSRIVRARVTISHDRDHD